MSDQTKDIPMTELNTDDGIPAPEGNLDFLADRVLHLVAAGMTDGTINDDNLLEMLGQHLPQVSTDYLRDAVRRAGLAQRFPATTQLHCMVTLEFDCCGMTPLEAARYVDSLVGKAPYRTYIVTDEDGNETRINLEETS